MPIVRTPVLVDGVVPASVLPTLPPADAAVAGIVLAGPETAAALDEVSAGVDSADLASATADLVPLSVVGGSSDVVGGVLLVEDGAHGADVVGDVVTYPDGAPGDVYVVPAVVGLPAAEEVAAKADRGPAVDVTFTGTTWPTPLPVLPVGGWYVFDSARHAAAPVPPATGNDADRWNAHPTSAPFDAAVAAGAPLAAPVLVSVTEPSPRVVRLEAQPVTGATEYRWFEESTTSGPVATTTVPVRQSGAVMIPGRTLTYWLTAIVDGRETPPSNRVPITIADPTPDQPPAPLPVPVVTVTEPAARAVRLTTDPVPGAVSYTWRTDTGILATTTGPTYQSGQTFQPGYTQSFWVVVDVEAQQVASVPVPFTFAPAATGVVAYTAPDDDYRIEVTWDDPTGAPGWQVNRVGTVENMHVTGPRFLSPRMEPGPQQYRVRPQTGTDTAGAPVYEGTWRTSNTVTVKAWPTPVGAELMWAPPKGWGRNGVTVINVADSVRIARAGDYELRLPTDRPLETDRTDFTLVPDLSTGARIRIMIVGGEMRASLAARIVAKIRATAGAAEVFIQGVRLSGGNAGDGWQVDMQELVDSMVTMQDCEVEALISGPVEHADGAQYYGGPATARWHRVKITSDYQGFMFNPGQFGRALERESGWYGAWSLHDVHIHMLENRALPTSNPANPWMGTGYYSIHTSGTGNPRIVYDRCYLTWEATASGVRPNRNISARTPDVTRGNQSPGIWDRVIEAPPPGGTVFKPGHRPGIGYVNPGYATPPTGGTPPPVVAPPVEAPAADTTAPDRPTYPAAEGGLGTVTLSWVPGVDDSGEPTKTRIRADGTSFYVTQPGVSTVTVSQINGVKLTPGREYRFTFAAVDAGGNTSGVTESVYATPIG